MLIKKIGYETKAIRWVLALLLSMDIFIAAMMIFFAPDDEMWVGLPIIAIMTFVAIVFGASPLLTKHEVHDTYVVLRQGWYYKNRIDLSDIVGIKRVRRGPWSFGVHFIGGGMLYVNGRLDDLILFELSERISRNGKRRRMTKVLFDTLDNDDFIRMIGREFDGEMDHL